MSDDFYVEAAQRRLDQINSQKAYAQAALTEAKADNDYHSAAAAVQEIANLNAEENNLRQLHRQHVASQNPPPPPRQTPEQIRAKPAEQMTWADGLEIARNSKYGKNLDFNDPHVQAGYYEASRRRSRGE